MGIDPRRTGGAAMKMWKKRCLWFLILLLFSCGKSGDNVTPGITVTPNFFIIPVGATLQLNTQVVGLSEPGYHWELVPNLGSVDSNDLYTAPDGPVGGSITARAVSDFDATIFGTSVINLEAGFQATKLNVASNSQDLRQVILGSASFQSSFSVGMTNTAGLPDLVTANCQAQSISIFWTDNQGNFSSTLNPPSGAGQTTVFVGACPVGLTAGVFVNGTTENNNKFVADAAVAIQTPPQVVVVPGDPTKVFDPNKNVTTLLPVLPSGAQLTAIASGLIDQDGNRDVVVTTDQNSVLLLRGNGDGSFVSTNPISVGQNPVSVVIFDFNLDGFQDVATANAGDSSLTVLLGDGQGGFPKKVTVGLTAPPAQLAIGDFNKDLRIDLIVSQPTANKVSLLLGKGDGRFEDPIAVPMDLPNSFPEGVAVADFNLDGFVDMAVASKNQNSVTVYYMSNAGFIQSGQPFIGKLTYDSTNLVPSDALNEPMSMVPFFLSFQASQIALGVLNSGSSPPQNTTLTILSAQ
jgi:hypothetical protein